MRTSRSTGIIGIDVGTSVIKTALFTLEGNMIGVSSRKTEVVRNRNSFAECDMHDVWAKVQECLQELMHDSRSGQLTICGVGITAQGDGTWLIDENNQPVRPAITWLDGRGAELVRFFHENGTAEKVFSITGTDINSSNQAVQLRWLKDNEPEAIANAKTVLRAKDWVFLNLTGKISTDFSDASFTYFNLNDNSYDSRVLELIGISDIERLLPEALPIPKNIAPIKNVVANSIGIPRDTPIVSGPIDVSASALGVGIYDIHDAVTVFGTAGIHQVVIDDPPGPPQNIGYTVSHGHHDRYLRLLPSKTGTLNSQWFVEQFYGEEAYSESGKIDWATIEAELEKIPVGSNGILYHPYIDPSGERVPFNNHTARAQFTGINLTHTKPQLLHAVFEGVILSALDCYSRFPFKPKIVRLTGGGANSNFWSQMFSDAIGAPVQHVIEKEAGCKGAMISAAVALGLYPDFETAIEKTIAVGKQFKPNLGRHEDYKELLTIFQSTYTAMFPSWQRMFDFAESRKKIEGGTPRK